MSEKQAGNASFCYEICQAENVSIFVGIRRPLCENKGGTRKDFNPQLFKEGDLG
ncbi:hypothetical protein HMPREF3213_03505 [Heyndrickxia coagulans]|uniref:Uncharacterized protein n=1 Tax=Heyndrickxia coagulans TaxID=1398 RepID=A0A150JNW4_HEYCO|nr:hypothetical protein BCO26_2030 [Heyndrickxia coagulans 2-6]KWZ77023.1 hypothetical protein HMPREF3213_03505 [Heyndrickxia coagulans]KYC58985.1 hypothetical protein B4099_2601 [Heyndrickxia coagulans]